MIPETAITGSGISSDEREMRLLSAYPCNAVICLELDITIDRSFSVTETKRVHLLTSITLFLESRIRLEYTKT